MSSQFDQLRQLLVQGEHAAAQALCDALLRDRPNDVALMQVLGGILVKGGAALPAAGLLARAVALRPNDPIPRNNLGMVLTTLGQLTQAVALFESALSLDPDNANFLFNLAYTYRENGQYGPALAIFERCIVLAPSNGRPVFEAAVTLALLRRFDEAVARYDDTLRLEPNHPFAADNRKGALEQLSRIAALELPGTADLLMLGDSNTESADWQEKFPHLAVRQCGVSGDSTSTIRSRLASIERVVARHVFISLGVNDFVNFKAPLGQVLENYRAIIDRLAHRADRVVVQSTILCNPSIPGAATTALNPQLGELNAALASLAGGKVLFLDINAGLCPQGFLRADLTTDGIHLNERGYVVWRDLLAPLLERAC